MTQPTDPVAAIMHAADMYADASGDLAVAVVRGEPTEPHQDACDRWRAELRRLVEALAAGGER